MNWPCKRSTTDSILIDHLAKLSGSNFSSPDMIAQMTGIFDKTTKIRFRKPDEPSYIKFGSTREKDLKYDIRSGQLKLAGFVQIL